MKLSKAQKSAVMLAVAVAMTGSLAEAQSRSRGTRGGVTVDQQTNAAAGTAGQSQQQRGGSQQQGPAQGVRRAERQNVFGAPAPAAPRAGQPRRQAAPAPARAPRVQQAATAAPGISAEVSRLSQAGLQIDNDTIATLEIVMKKSAANADMVADVARNIAQNQTNEDSLKDYVKSLPKGSEQRSIANYIYLKTRVAAKSATWAAAVKANKDLVVNEVEAGIRRGATCRSAFDAASEALANKTKQEGADKEVNMQQDDITEWC